MRRITEKVRESHIMIHRYMYEFVVLIYLILYHMTIVYIMMTILSYIYDTYCDCSIYLIAYLFFMYD